MKKIIAIFISLFNLFFILPSYADVCEASPTLTSCPSSLSATHCLLQLIHQRQCLMQAD